MYLHTWMQIRILLSQSEHIPTCKLYEVGSLTTVIQKMQENRRMHCEAATRVQQSEPQRGRPIVPLSPHLGEFGKSAHPECYLIGSGTPGLKRLKHSSSVRTGVRIELSIPSDGPAWHLRMLHSPHILQLLLNTSVWESQRAKSPQST